MPAGDLPESGREVSESTDPGREVSGSTDPGREVSESTDPGREVSGSTDPGREAGSGWWPCAVIPTFDNPETVRDVARSVRAHLPVIVVDDGSGPAGRAAVDALDRERVAHVHHRDRNGGKGAAVTTGFEIAAALGYSHALQIDADGQHELADIPRLLSAARERPDALILGAPVYDESAPRGRLIGRKITQFWTNLETHGRVIDDPMCGFRVYPVERALEVAGYCGQRMDFDIEIAVRLVWAGLPVINVPTRVRYHEGGVSHFHMIRDNARISWMHSKLVVESWRRALFGARPERSGE